MAEAIREESCISFNMALYSNWCGTAGCIAGTAIALLAPAKWEEMQRFRYTVNESRIGGALLGCSTAQGDELFAPPGYRDKTKEQAADTLERFARTGKVQWL